MTTRVKPNSRAIPIYQGDDAERLAEIRMSVAIAERQLEQKRELLASGHQRARRVGDPVAVTSDEIAACETEVRAKQDEYDAAVDVAADNATEVRVQAIGRRRFRELVSAHPVRTSTNDAGETVDDEDDVQYGVNVETFPLALLTYVDSEDTEFRTITEPEFKGSKEAQDFFDDQVSDGDFEKIWIAAYWINRAAGGDPKALRYSSRNTGETSE